MINKLINPLRIICLCLIAFSFLIKNDYNELLFSQPEWFFSDFWSALDFFSLLLLFCSIGLSIYKLNIDAYWTSLSFLILQVFESGIRKLFYLNPEDYIIHSIGVILIVLNFYFYSKQRKLGNKIILGLGILYLVFTSFMSWIDYNYDNFNSVIVIVIVGLFLFYLQEKVNSRLFIFLQLIYFIVLVYLATYNLNCNIHYEDGHGKVVWNIKDLYSCCGSYYLWIISGMIVHSSILMKLNSPILSEKTHSA